MADAEEATDNYNYHEFASRRLIQLPEERLCILTDIPGDIVKALAWKVNKSAVSLLCPGT